MKNHKAKLLLAGLVLAISAPHAQAQLIAYDGFDDVGNVVGFSSPFVHRQDGPGLSYSKGGDLVTAPGSTPFYKSETAALSAPVTGTFYVSFLVEPQVGAKEFRFDLTNSDSGNGFTLESQLSPKGIARLRVWTNNNFDFSNADDIGPVEGTQFYVLEVSPSVVKAWLNPSLGAPLGTPDAKLYGMNANGGFNTIQLVKIADWNTPGQGVVFDEVRIGRSFEDVTPVPGASAYGL